MTFAPHAVHESGIRWLSVRNDSSEDVPAFGVMRITGVTTLEGQAVLTVDKPNADGGTFHVFNGPFKIAAGGYGSGTCDLPCFAFYDDSNSPALGDEYGVQSGKWKLYRGFGGFRVVGGTQGSTGSKRVQITLGDDIIRFELYGNLIAGGSASAKLVRWNGSAYSTGSETITVVDFIGSFSGIVGNRGFARWASDVKAFEIFQLKC